MNNDSNPLNELPKNPNYESTSGIMVMEYEDGRVMVGYVDYGVSALCCSEFECEYYFDAKNAKILKEELAKLHKGNFEQQCTAEFGKNFSEQAFNAFVTKHKLECSRSTWRNFDIDWD